MEEAEASGARLIRLSAFRGDCSRLSTNAAGGPELGVLGIVHAAFTNVQRHSAQGRAGYWGTEITRFPEPRWFWQGVRA